MSTEICWVSKILSKFIADIRYTYGDVIIGYFEYGQGDISFKSSYLHEIFPV